MDPLFETHTHTHTHTHTLIGHIGYSAVVAVLCVSC